MCGFHGDVCGTGFCLSGPCRLCGGGLLGIVGDVLLGCAVGGVGVPVCGLGAWGGVGDAGDVSVPFRGRFLGFGVLCADLVGRGTVFCRGTSIGSLDAPVFSLPPGKHLLADTRVRRAFVKAL